MTLETLIIAFHMLQKRYSPTEIEKHIGAEATYECLKFLSLDDPWKQIAMFIRLKQDMTAKGWHLSKPIVVD